MTRAHGYDASMPVDWSRLGGRDFGMVKATEGTSYVAPAFKANWEKMGVQGSSRFAYHFFHADQDPLLQAQLLTATVREAGLGTYDHFVCDYEVSSGVPPVQASFAAWVFCREINRMNPGHRCLVYTMPAFANGGYTAKLGSWFLWVADWGVEAPDVPPPWREWTFWQYASGMVLDYDVYNGDSRELEEFVSHSGGA